MTIISINLPFIYSMYQGGKWNDWKDLWQRSMLTKISNNLQFSVGIYQRWFYMLVLAWKRHDKTQWIDGDIINWSQTGRNPKTSTTGELKCLYSRGISSKTPRPHPPLMHTLPPAPTKVMASSKRGTKQLQPLLFHWRSSSAQREPSALRLNQYKCCALQLRTRIFRHPVIVESFTQRIDGLQQTNTVFQEAHGPTNHASVTGWMISTPAAIN